MKTIIKNALCKLTISLLTLLIFLITIWVKLPFEKEDVDYKERLVAHGCGIIDGYIQTNSKEALLRSLNDGLKNIEVDLYITKDSQLVCVHDLALFSRMCERGDSMPIYLSDFKQCKIYGRYTPLTFKEVLDYQSVWNFTIWTDKISDVKILNKFIPYSSRYNIRVEAFCLADYQELKKNGYVPMYSASLRYKDIARFIQDCFENKSLIDFLVVSHRSFDFYLRVLRKLGVKIAVYTQNNQVYINKHLFKEADFIYIDSIQ